MTPGRASPPTRGGRVTSVTGSTASANFPTTPGAHDPTYNGNGDAFVATFDGFSTLAYSTFLGGTGSDAGSGIAVDEKGKLAYVTGSTASADYPTAESRGRHELQRRRGRVPHVTEAIERELVRSTFLGGTGTMPASRSPSARTGSGPT